MKHLTDGKMQVEATVRGGLTGTPELSVPDQDHVIQPDCIKVEYLFESHQQGGSWVAVDVEVVGSQVLVAAADGSQRLGGYRYLAAWSRYSLSGDVQTDFRLPEWLHTLVSDLRPEGQLTLPLDN